MRPPRYPLLLVPHKRGCGSSAFVLRHVHTVCPVPTPPPARARPPSSLRKRRDEVGRTARCPPHSRGGLYYHAYPLRQGPNPHPSPRSLRSLPPPTPGGGLITFAIPSTKAIPSHGPTLPPRAPGRPRPSASSGTRSAGLLAAPRAAPGGFDYIYYTMETIIACPPPITPPQQQWPLCSPLATICRRLRRLRLLQMHARGERCWLTLYYSSRPGISVKCNS